MWWIAMAWAAEPRAVDVSRVLVREDGRLVSELGEALEQRTR